MRVLLIKPPTGGVYGSMKGIKPEYPPLGLAYLAAFLEKDDHEVKILDLSVEEFSKTRLRSFTDDFSPGVIGVTANTPTVESAYEIVSELRETDPKLMVLGGPHPTALPGEALDYADVVVRGEGEETLQQVVNVANNKGFSTSELRSIEGISFVHHKKKIHNAPRALNINLDDYPLPSRNLLNIKKYRYFGAKKYPLTNIFTSRGCPYKCSYCNKQIFGNRFRARSPQNVLEEIDHLVNDLGVKEVHISDDTFTLNKKRVLEICRLVKQRNYDLAFFPHNGVRANTIDEELLQAMKSCGFYAMVFGVESGNQRILENINKDITLDEIRNAFRLSKQYGFETWGFFIFGLWGETKRTIKDTIDFAIELDPDIAKMHILVPYPGTRDYERLKDRLLIKRWSDYQIFGGPTFEPENMTSEELHKLFKQAYRRFYFRPKPIVRTLAKSIKSPRTLAENVRAGLSVVHIGT